MEFESIENLLSPSGRRIVFRHRRTKGEGRRNEANLAFSRRRRKEKKIVVRWMDEEKDLLLLLLPRLDLRLLLDRRIFVHFLLLSFFHLNFRR